MLEGVGQRLLDDPVGGQLDAGVERPADALHRQLDRKAGGADLLDERAEALKTGHRLARGSSGAADPLGFAQDPEHPAHVGQCRAAGPVDGLERGSSILGSPIECGQAGTRLDDDDADVMGHDVVQLARDPLPFVLDGPSRPVLAFRLLEAGVLLDRGGVAAARVGPVAERQDDDDSQHRREEPGHRDLLPADLVKITAANVAPRRGGGHRDPPLVSLGDGEQRDQGPEALVDDLALGQ